MTGVCVTLADYLTSIREHHNYRENWPSARGSEQVFWTVHGRNWNCLLEDVGCANGLFRSQRIGITYYPDAGCNRVFCLQGAAADIFIHSSIGDSRRLHHTHRGRPLLGRDPTRMVLEWE